VNANKLVGHSDSDGLAAWVDRQYCLCIAQSQQGIMAPCEYTAATSRVESCVVGWLSLVCAVAVISRCVKSAFIIYLFVEHSRKWTIKHSKNIGLRDNQAEY